MRNKVLITTESTTYCENGNSFLLLEDTSSNSNSPKALFLEDVDFGKQFTKYIYSFARVKYDPIIDDLVITLKYKSNSENRIKKVTLSELSKLNKLNKYPVKKIQRIKNNFIEIGKLKSEDLVFIKLYISLIRA